MEIHYDISNSSFYLPIWTYVWGDMTLFMSVFSKHTFHGLLSEELPEKLQLSGELRPPSKWHFLKKKIVCFRLLAQEEFCRKGFEADKLPFWVIKIKDNRNLNCHRMLNYFSVVISLLLKRFMIHVLSCFTLTRNWISQCFSLATVMHVMQCWVRSSQCCNFSVKI